MAIASDFSRGPTSARKQNLNGFIVIEPAFADAYEHFTAADESDAETTDCRVGSAVKEIYRAALELARALQSRELTAAHLIMAILADEAARSELKTMGVRNEVARAACYAQIGAQGAAASGTGGLQRSAEDAMRNLLRRAMERARHRHDPELQVVGVGDLCAALMDLSREELRIRMLLQGTRPLSATEVAVREAERNILQRLTALERQGTRGNAKAAGSALVKVAAGIALLAAAALASWYAIGASGSWSTALGWLGRLLA